jgi:ribosome silencing factor RsfS/YbeB/iojap
LNTRNRKTAVAEAPAEVEIAASPKRMRKTKAAEPVPAKAAEPAPVKARRSPAASAETVADPTAKPARRAASAASNSAAPSTSRQAAGKAPVAAVATPRKARVAKKSAEPTIDVRVRDAVVARLDAMKAVDMKVIDVRGKTSVTDCIVIASGTSTRHVKSMGDEVVVTAKKFGMPPLGVEGEKDAEWMLVDLGDTVVHVMLPRTREFYGLERLWTLAEESRAASAV